MREPSTDVSRETSAGAEPAGLGWPIASSTQE
jgi:hypothetical protein